MISRNYCAFACDSHAYVSDTCSCVHSGTAPGQLAQLWHVGSLRNHSYQVIINSLIIYCIILKDCSINMICKSNNNDNTLLESIFIDKIDFRWWWYSLPSQGKISALGARVRTSGERASL